jgi:hypothetical protein
VAEDRNLEEIALQGFKENETGQGQEEKRNKLQCFLGLHMSG